MSENSTKLEMDQKELDVIREWFQAVQDLNPDYLESRDFLLFGKIMNQLGMRVSLRDQAIIDTARGEKHE